MLSSAPHAIDYLDYGADEAPLRPRYFRLHAVRSNRPAPVHVRPRDLLGRLCAWVLGRRGLLVCVPGEPVEIVGRQLVQMLDFSSIDVFALIQEQLSWYYKYTEKRPSKVIIGPALAAQLTGKQIDPELFYKRGVIDESVPLIGGMELVINPHVDWVVLG